MKLRNIPFLKMSLLLMLVLILSFCSSFQKKAETTPALVFDNMDTSYNPADDLFMYMNGKWVKEFEIPGEYTRYGAFNELGQKSIKDVKSLLDNLQNAEFVAQGSITQKLSDFISTGMDSLKADELGIQPIEKWIKLIDNIKNEKDFFITIFHLQQQGISPLFSFFGWADPNNADMNILHLGQGGLGLPDKDYYLKDDERSIEIREKYIEHVEKMLILMGYESQSAKNAASKIMAIETQLAEVSMSRLERRDPNKTKNPMIITDLKSKYSNIPWDTFLIEMDLEHINELNMRQPDFYKGMNAMLENVPIDDWKHYLNWNLINRTSMSLNHELVQQDFDFYSKFLSGQEEMRPRWKRVQGNVNGALGEAVGQLYVQEYFPPEAKERMINLVRNLRISLENRIKNLEWMSDDTKNEALIKLAAINVKIGYPDKWKDYSELNIDQTSYCHNVLVANAFNFQEEMKKIGKPMDKDEWGMTPQTVNAYYSPALNEICFPAAILQPPFFNMNADDAVNYGAIGVVIGHEMTHGFDDSGRKFDADGNIRDWWTKEDAENFTKRADVLVKQFDSYVAIDTFRVNGKLTLGENLADLGGLNISYDAFKNATSGKNINKLEGYTADQRFILSYAQIWRVKHRDKALIRQVQENPHSPGNFRANGGVRNFDVFYSAFNVTEENDLYIAPENRVVIW